MVSLLRGLGGNHGWIGCLGQFIRVLKPLRSAPPTNNTDELAFLTNSSVFKSYPMYFLACAAVSFALVHLP